MAIRAVSLHHIDVAADEVRLIEVDQDNEDLNTYLNSLLREVARREQNRRFKFESATTEFRQAAEKALAEADLGESGKTLAQRLLAKERIVEDRMGHLGGQGDGHLKRGSLLQFVYEDDEGRWYLGVKVDHQIYLDEAELRKRAGLSWNRNVYKACRTKREGDGVAEEVRVYDTYAAPSKYWWQDFLELKEVMTSERNTEMAAKRSIARLGPIMKASPADYTWIRNAAITYFKTAGTYRHEEFIDLLKEYPCVTPEGSAARDKVIEKIRELPAKYGYDTEFPLVPEQIKFRKQTVRLMVGVNLTIAEPPENLRERIWAEEDSEGRKLVVIDSQEGYRYFRRGDGPN